MNVTELAEAIVTSAKGRQRYLVAIAGAPASGKTTLSKKLKDEVDRLSEKETCSVVPMDGFHLNNNILEHRNLLARKGAPETFDASGFLHLVRRLRKRSEDIFYPTFNRDLDMAVAGAGVLSPDQPIILIEGNYLLCDVPVWCELRTEFDYSIYLDVPLETLETRLIQRWLDQGYDAKGAANRARSNDIPNAEFVVEKSGKADLVIH